MKSKEKIVTAFSIVNDINKQNSIFTPTTTSVPIVHLKGIGRFCEREGCGKRLEGKLVRRRIGGKEREYFRPSPTNKRFCSKYCKNLDGIKKWKRNPQPKTLHAVLKLKVLDDKEPYRELVIYLNTSYKQVFKITKQHKELWEFAEKISRFRESPLKQLELTI